MTRTKASTISVAKDNTFEVPPFELAWSDHKMNHGPFGDTGWRHARVGDLRVYVLDNRAGILSKPPKTPVWRVRINAADGPRMIERHKGGGSMTWTETEVPLHPLTGQRFARREQAMAAAQNTFQQIARFAADMVEVATTKEVKTS